MNEVFKKGLGDAVMAGVKPHPVSTYTGQVSCIENIKIYQKIKNDDYKIQHNNFTILS